MTPKRPTVTVDPDTRAAIDAMLLKICGEHGVWLSHVVSQRKTTKIANARHAILTWMRQAVVMQRAKDGTVHLGLAEQYGGYSTWHQVSYPVIAELLGCDHSTLVLMSKRKPRDVEAKRRKRPADPTPDEIAAAKAGMRA